MGMSPKEYDVILYRDLMFKMDGFKDRLNFEEEVIRRLAYTTYRAPHLNPKKLANNIDAFWPKPGGTGKSDNKKISDAKRKAVREELQKRRNGQTGN